MQHMIESKLELDLLPCIVNCRQHMSSSLRSMMSTPSHTDRTDAAMSFTASSPSLPSLSGSLSASNNHMLGMLLL